MKPNKRKLYDIIGKPPRLNHTPDDFWPLPETFIGVEIEVEGVNQRKIAVDPIDRRWQVVEDHSLRGGEEWILRTPLLGASLKEAISWFFKNVSNYTISSRTSTHIHINMMDDDCDADALRNTLGLYIAAEDYFFSIAGEERKWSGYCLPMSEAPQDVLAAMIRVPVNYDAVHRALGIKREKADRYYALNLLSLQKHGTLEFRHFPCTNNEQDVIDWVKLAMHLKLGGMRMSKDDVNIFADMTEPQHVREMLTKYVPEIADNILHYCDQYTILSRISAIHTYASEQPPDFYYNADIPGVFKAWVDSKGALPQRRKGDEADRALSLRQAQIMAAEMAAGGRRMEAEQYRQIMMRQYLENNAFYRKKGGNGMVIPPNIRYVRNVDMLPFEERELQEFENQQRKEVAEMKKKGAGFGMNPPERRGNFVVDEAAIAPRAYDIPVYENPLNKAKAQAAKNLDAAVAALKKADVKNVDPNYPF